MPTIAVLNNRQTTDAAQVFSCRGAQNLSITLSNAAAYLAFAHQVNEGIPGSLGLEEFTPPQLLEITGEAIDAVSFRSAAPGVPAQITIIATRGGMR